MLIENLMNDLKEYELGNYAVYIDIGTGIFPLEKIELQYINSEDGVIVLKSYNE